MKFNLKSAFWGLALIIPVVTGAMEPAPKPSLISLMTFNIRRMGPEKESCSPLGK